MSQSDEELIAGVAAGDREAFATLYRQRRPDVYRFALHMTGSPSVAEDVAQEVFLAVIREAARYTPGRSGLVPWLLGIARNHALRRITERRDDPLPESGHEPGIDADPADGIARGQDIAALRGCACARCRSSIAKRSVLCDLQELPWSGTPPSRRNARSARFDRGCIAVARCSPRHSGKAHGPRRHVRSRQPVADALPALKQAAVVPLLDPARETLLLQAFDAAHTAPRRRDHWYLAAFAAAAALLLALALPAAIAGIVAARRLFQFKALPDRRRGRCHCARTFRRCAPPDFVIVPGAAELPRMESGTLGAHGCARVHAAVAPASRRRPGRRGP